MQVNNIHVNSTYILLPPTCLLKSYKADKLCPAVIVVHFKSSENFPNTYHLSMSRQLLSFKELVWFVEGHLVHVYLFMRYFQLFMELPWPSGYELWLYV